ncbi:MAG TPA: outer membrane beta-barrel protein, partial [Chitinophagaceae bacterium]|nr:outer membrane beta-barrel protein [Chitinophagaceae bacterium]
MRSLLTLVKKPLFSFIFFSFFLSQKQLQAQEISVTFKIVNFKKEPVPFASFEVNKRSDSSQVLKKIADSSGNVIFSLSKNVQYLVRISSVNYLPVEKTVTVTGTHTAFVFTAQGVPKTLTTVTVTAKRPLMRQEDDKTIVDPENLAAISTNGYEILEKTPGIFVDQDGNVYLNSMTPSVIYINGRDMKMSAADIATLLKNLPSNAISKIEIIRTPSAKYDASTSGGIVNIVLRKGIKLGLTGSVNAGLNQGTYGNQFAGFTLNNSNDNRHSYINFNYGKRNSFERIKTDRLYAIDTMLSQDAYTVYPANSCYLGYGLGYDLGKKWEIDFNGNISLNNSNNNSENQNTIKKISTSQTEAANLNSVNNKGKSIVKSNGIEVKLKIDTSGSEWTNDFFYSYAHNKSGQLFTTVFSFPAIPSSAGDGSSDNKRNYFFSASDLKLKMQKRFTLETGLKSSVHDFNNVADYFAVSGGSRIKDNSRTNTFQYKENINSFYLQGSKTLDKDIVIKMGVRMENTNMTGRQIIPSDTSFNIHRTDLFPYIYLSKSVMKIAGYDLKAYLVYRRTISRPVYEQLNPFPRYVDQYLSETGNPSLRPQFTQNYE